MQTVQRKIAIIFSASIQRQIFVQTILLEIKQKDCLWRSQKQRICGVGRDPQVSSPAPGPEMSWKGKGQIQNRTWAPQNSSEHSQDTARSSVISVMSFILKHIQM